MRIWRYPALLPRFRVMRIRRLLKYQEIEDFVSGDTPGVARKDAAPVATKWVITSKDTETTEANLPPNKEMKAKRVARGLEDPAQKDGLLINPATLAFRESNQMVLSVGVLEGQDLQKVESPMQRGKDEI